MQHAHRQARARCRAQAVDKAGGKSTTFGTITVSDGISNGAPGMRYSLVSREVIADSIETVAGAQGFDGVVAIGGCDKNMPGCMMALARLESARRCSSTAARSSPVREHRDVISVFEARGAFASGQDLASAQMKEIERTAIPGPGSCAGMYTANTMASAIEALGMSLPNSSAQEAVSRHKLEDCRSAGKAVVKLAKARHHAVADPDARSLRECDHRGRSRCRRLDQRRAASAGDGARGERASLELDDFTRIGKRVPVLADLRPSGKYMMSELIRIGGIQPLMKIAARTKGCCTATA